MWILTANTDGLYEHIVGVFDNEAELDRLIERYRRVHATWRFETRWYRLNHVVGYEDHNDKNLLDVPEQGPYLFRCVLDERSRAPRAEVTYAGAEGDDELDIDTVDHQHWPREYGGQQWYGVYVFANDHDEARAKGTALIETFKANTA